MGMAGQWCGRVLPRGEPGVLTIRSYELPASVEKKMVCLKITRTPNISLIVLQRDEGKQVDLFSVLLAFLIRARFITLLIS